MTEHFMELLALAGFAMLAYAVAPYIERAIYGLVWPR